jgi:ATP-binding cassette subfamily C (CFTR/MRP) protein 1
MAPLITYAIYLVKENSMALGSGKLFSSLLLLRLITQPMNTVFQAAPTLFSALACLGRIQGFILDDSRKDIRTQKYRSQLSLVSARVSKESKIFESTSTSAEELPYSAEEKSASALSAISVRDGTFGWGVDTPPTLQNINLDIEFASLTMIVGHVASGKSTLLKALLGELPKSTGYVDVARRRIAFCDQTPWITNATLQQNILGYSAYDRDWYKTVVHGCMLDQDLAGFPGKDQTVVGSNGINLSGGQKQRLVSLHYRFQISMVVNCPVIGNRKSGVLKM